MTVYEYERYSYTKGEHAGVSRACSQRRVGKLRNRPTGLHAPSPRPDGAKLTYLLATDLAAVSALLDRPLADQPIVVPRYGCSLEKFSRNYEY